MDEMSGVLRKALAIELAAVPSIDKELDRAAQGLKASGETAGLANQAGPVMT